MPSNPRRPFSSLPLIIPYSSCITPVSATNAPTALYRTRCLSAYQPAQRTYRTDSHHQRRGREHLTNFSTGNTLTGPQRPRVAFTMHSTHATVCSVASPIDSRPGCHSWRTLPGPRFLAGSFIHTASAGITRGAQN
ncbi:hypothetical protein BJ170DRAFT_122157 [Xylariales sp. AK1849]|nr:hypothetical protein BJ170DRAFT_122157 [Xylariales sp. AK1849]